MKESVKKEEKEPKYRAANIMFHCWSLVIFASSWFWYIKEKSRTTNMNSIEGVSQKLVGVNSCRTIKQ